MKDNDILKCECPICPDIDVDGFISSGKQFDLKIKLPKDDRDLIYGVVTDYLKNPIKDAAVKLVEIVDECDKKRLPVAHTFTDENGEFVFGPLCPGKKYGIQIWVNDTKQIKICAKCFVEGDCLKGNKNKKCDCFVNCKDED